MAKAKKISKELSVEELNTQVLELQQQLFKLNLQKMAGQLEKTSQLRMIRRDIARAKTFLTQKA
jgi:large subunit ribosomal protein L29